MTANTDEKQDYKHTLNLPATDFPMKANLASREPEILKTWEQNKLYQAIRTANIHKPEFILHDGPIYANGNLHIGHAVNRILKDIVIKSKSLDGFDAPFVPGWDCHGLPIELNIEKKYGKAGEKLDAKAFRQKCREYASLQVDIQREAFKRLGVIADWEHPYLTMDFKFEADIIRALSRIIQENHLQQGFKPVHWCTECRSALAEAEVEYQSKTSLAIDVKFRVTNPDSFPGEGELSIPIWTTTPWTLPANEAVALNAGYTYVLIQLDNKTRLILLKDLLHTSCARYNLSTENYSVLAEYQQDKLQADFKNLRLQHPLDDTKTVPVIFGDHVTLETGTGAVHTAPSHGLEDYLAGQVYHLPLNNPVDEKGCFKLDIPVLAGEFIFKANAKIIQLLQNKNNLLAENKLEHSYPHCWRHKTPLIFRAAPQWFISMEKNHLRENALKVIQETHWLPDWGQARMDTMIRNRPDWCISRQRQWCMPMGLVVNKHTKTLHPETALLAEKIAQKIEQGGLEAWYDLDINTLLPAEDQDQYEKISDTLDVWFDSGVTHFAVLKEKTADLYLEGSDQHRGWFNSSLLTSVAMTQKAPYKTVLTHGFTVDDQNRKMSKSLGNVISPEKIIKNSGADVLRLWVAATDYRAEMTVSEEVFARTSEAYRRIRNTMRFLLANLHDFDPQKNRLENKDLLSLDDWIVEKARILQEEIRTAYQHYEFHLIYQKLHNFCIVELGGFYLDIIKDRQYTLQKNNPARRSAQTAIYHILQAMVRWISPILSFTAEEIWGYLNPQNKHNSYSSIFLTTFYVFPENKLNKNFINWPEILKLRESVNKAIEAKRNLGEIGSALQACVLIKAPQKIMDLLRPIEQELHFVWISSKAVLEESDDFSIEITPVHQPKCVRCWHQREDIGQDKNHPEICLRCVDNLPDGKGEKRLYA